MTRLIAALVMMISIPTEAQVQRYDLNTVRTQLLAIRDGLPAQTVVIQGGPQSGPQADFLNFYANVVHPKMQAALRLYQRRSALSVLIDTGSYLNEEEASRWKEEYEKLSDQINAMAVDPVYNGEIARWGQMAQGLNGELAAYARQFAYENDLGHFPENMRTTLTEVDMLHMAYKEAIIKAPSAKGISEFNKRVTEIPRLFKAGKLTFAQAAEQLNEVSRTIGYRFVGYDAVQSQGAALNKLAVLRTQLAKSKGFNTWAEYQLENTGQGYSPEYRGTVNQRKFLHTWLEQLRPQVEKYIEKRALELGVNKADLRRQHLSLLTLPDLSSAQAYFPAETLTDIWQKVMIESGFKPETLRQIIVDDKPREGLKNPTMAYMAGIVTPESETLVIDGQDLSFMRANAVRPGTMYIMQTYRGAGLRDLRTAFHEGMGHALEYLLKEKELLTDEGYGYVEVPSTTAEYFLRDAQMLRDNATPVDGKIPSLKEFRTWIKNQEKNALVELIARAGSALYDLDLWDYDYTQEGAQTYLERAQVVNAEVEARAGHLPSVEASVPVFYSQVSTTHFTSGNVRNIGYSYASIGAEMMAQYLSRELKRRTGRASWYKQPGLAELISESWYKKAWKTPFPKNIELITGQKFDMPKILHDLTKDSGCEDDL